MPWRVDRWTPVLVLLAIGLASCGQIGEPLPPALHIAMPVQDLRVVEYGDRLVIDFTIPPLSTEGVVIRRIGEVDLRIGPGGTPFEVNQWAATARKIPVNATGTGPVHADVPVTDWIGKEVVVGVRVINPKGRASSWSNLVPVAVVPPVATPADVVAEAAPQGARVTWRSPEQSFRVFRRGPTDKEPALIGNADKPEYTDATAQFGTEYQYMVQALRDRAESSISAPVSIKPEDKFPPAAPSGVTGLAGIGSIELVWERNTEPDMRGYRVYRATASGNFERISEFTEAPAYSDRQIEAGKKYRYAVTALDQSGNESTMSTPVEVTAP